MHDDRDVTVIESDSGSGFKWFLIGAVVGAGAALLLAPQSGERTRRELMKRGKKLRARAEGAIEDITDEIQTRGRRIKESAEEFAEEVMDEVRENQRKSERAATGARDGMERRLAEARARARAGAGVEVDDDEDDDESE